MRSSIRTLVGGLIAGSALALSLPASATAAAAAVAYAPGAPAADSGVIGGTPVTTEQYPWAVALVQPDALRSQSLGAVLRWSAVGPHTVVTRGALLQPDSPGQATGTTCPTCVSSPGARISPTRPAGRCAVRGVWVNPAYDPLTNSRRRRGRHPAEPLPAGTVITHGGSRAMPILRGGHAGAGARLGGHDGPGRLPERPAMAASVSVLADAVCEQAYPGSVGRHVPDERHGVRRRSGRRARRLPGGQRRSAGGGRAADRSGVLGLRLRRRRGIPGSTPGSRRWRDWSAGTL